MNRTFRRMRVILLAVFSAGSVVVLAGCHAIDFSNPILDGPVPREQQMPREKIMRSLPTHRISPPDVLGIEVLKLVPLPPYRVHAHDVLQIRASNVLPDEPIDGLFIVEAEGTVKLAPTYGSVRVIGMTIDEITVAIQQHLMSDAIALRSPGVSVELARASGTQEITNQYFVGPDGTVNLRRYGSLHVAGKTVAEAKAALEKHLSQFFDSPKASVDVLAYNSKKYYVIAQGAGLGDTVVPVPITGKETVLDAIGKIGGLTQMSSRKIWIARPTPGSYACSQILPVDWEAITRGGASETNYQIMPGDRVFIAEDPAAAITNAIAKLTGPIERLGGTSGLITGNIQGWSAMGRGYNRNFRR